MFEYVGFFQSITRKKRFYRRKRHISQRKQLMIVLNMTFFNSMKSINVKKNMIISLNVTSLSNNEDILESVEPENDEK